MLQERGTWAHKKLLKWDLLIQFQGRLLYLEINLLFLKDEVDLISKVLYCCATLPILLKVYLVRDKLQQVGLIVLKYHVDCSFWRKSYPESLLLLDTGDVEGLTLG